MSPSTGRAASHPLVALPRVWWFPGLPGYRTGRGVTYLRHALDEQPVVPARDDLGWLEQENPKPEWAIADGDAVRALTSAGLAAIADQLPVALPESLRLLAARPELQRRIRSATACFLDLGDFPAVTSGEDGFLVHVLSDQQWCLHWLLYLDTAGCQAVVATPEPIGLDLSDDESGPGSVIRLDDEQLGMTVCADTFAEFLYRFWIENEIFFAQRSNQPLTPALATYAAKLAPATSLPAPAKLASNSRRGGRPHLPPTERSAGACASGPLVSAAPIQAIWERSPRQSQGAHDRYRG